MRLNVENRLPWDVETDVLAVTVPAVDALPEYLAEIDRRLGGVIGQLRAVGAMPGKLWDARLLPAREMGARFVLAVGVGDGDAIDQLGAQRLGAVIVKRLAGLDVASLAIHVPDELVAKGGAGQAAVVELLTRGLVEGAADPKSIYTAPTEVVPELDVVTYLVESGEPATLVDRAERGRIIGEGGNRTRRLAHRSANDVSPEVLADEASDLARACLLYTSDAADDSVLV